MSGGIKYRLTSRERILFADQLGVLEALRARLKPGGIDAKVGDAEMEVSVEEETQGPRISIEYPFDTDSIPNNGRLYVKDTFRLNQDSGQILSVERSVRQDIQAAKSVRYWVEVARKDHPQEKITSYVDHLKRFVDDLNKLPKPEREGTATRLFLEKVLAQLHRPFPPNNEKVVRKNFAVFKELAEKVAPLGIRMKFGDPQSGLVLRREGDKLILGVQVVLDNDLKPGLESEKNGRMYLMDSYELDPDTKKVLAAHREVLPSENPSKNFDAAFAKIKDEPAPPVDQPELQALVDGWLEGLGNAAKEAPADPPPATGPKISQAPEDPAGKKLYALYLETEPRKDSTNSFLMALANQGSGPAAYAAPLMREPDRAAIHELLGYALLGDAVGAGQALAAWSQGQEFQPETLAVLQALEPYARGEVEAARKALLPFLPYSGFTRRLSQALEARARQDSRQAALEILKTAALERMEKLNAEDKAWLKGIFGGSPPNPEQRRGAVHSFFKRLEAGGAVSGNRLAADLTATPAQGNLEQELKAWLLENPAMQELVSALDESDPGLRQGELLRIARTKLLGTEKLPAAAKAIAERCDERIPEARALRNWFSGKASFGQKAEFLAASFTEEVLAPRTILSMMAAGTMAQVGKAVFFSRFGYQTRRLRLAAEAASVALEAPTFVLTDKIVASAWTSPERQWDHLGRDMFGALVAFGTLRGSGLISRRLVNSLEASKALETFSAGRSRWALAERLLPQAEGLLKAEGRRAGLSKLAGKAAVPTLKYLGTTGVSRRWIPPLLRGLSTHGLSLGALMSANSLTRLLGLREASPQGWSSDLTDDVLMYGHFLVAGHLARRLGRSELDTRLSLIEGLPLEAKAEPKRPEPAEGAPPDPAARASEPPASEKLPALDVPPELKDFGRNLRKWALDFFPQLGRLGAELMASLRSLRGKQAVPETPKVDIPEASGPESSKEQTSPAPASAPKAPSVPPIPETKPAGPPPAEGDQRPTVPAQPPALLRPAEERVNFRMLEPDSPAAKGKENKVTVEVMGREEDLLVPVKGGLVERSFESILGREELQSPAQAVGIDFGFASIHQDIAPQHAKLSVRVRWEVKNTKEGASANLKDWELRIEDMNSPTGTFLNGERVTKAMPLKDGDRIRLGEGSQELLLRLDKVQPDVFLVRPEIPLLGSNGEWLVGREQAGAKTPDIPFPLSDRDISRRHARILRDAEGRYFLQDLSSLGTRLNSRRIHGTLELQDGDRLQFGNFGELVFEFPKGVEAAKPLGDKPLPTHPREALPPPEQAAVHPAYRGKSAEEVENLFHRLSAEEEVDPSDFRAGQLRLPDERSILLNSLHTGWAIGFEGELTGNSQALRFSAPPEAAKHPVLIYLDRERGQFTLRPLRPEAEVFVQPRPERHLSPEGKARKPTGARQRLQGWTRLEGGERIFLGPDFYFDFWPAAPTPLQENLVSALGSIPAEAPAPVEIKTSPIQPKFLLGGGESEILLNQPVVFRSSESGQGIPQPAGPGKPAHTEVLLPEADGKIHETRLFQAEDGSWKIRSEGGDGEPVRVNGMRLPAGLELDLLPDSLIEAGNKKFKLRLP
ncbi:MAG: FHA domain-containing protein [bacterium]